MNWLRMHKRASAFILLLCIVEHSQAQQAWPGSSSVDGVDKTGQGLESNSSGLTYQLPTAAAPGYLWVVKNKPPRLHKLVMEDNGKFANEPSNGWSNGKILSYTNGKGKPDSEGVAMTSLDQNFVYVATEKKGKGVKGFMDSRFMGKPRRLSVLRYDVSGSATKLKASHEWDLGGEKNNELENILA